MKNKIEKTVGFIQQALSNLSGDTSQTYTEVRSHLKQALKSLNKVQQKENKKKTKENQFEQWWGSVQSGVAKSNFSNLSKEAQLNSLNKINELINAEQNKIDELENKAIQYKSTPKDQELLIE